jgi:para-aminobenzoate synthetase
MSTSVSSQPAWNLRTAAPDDAEPIARAVQRLLLELDGIPGDLESMTVATRALIRHDDLGVIFVAESDRVLIGLLAASWVHAIHVPGRYALIQDLWVDPAWRSRDIGKSLLIAISELARDHQIPRVEVGLPLHTFASFDATHAFYLSNEFTPNGPRLRKLLL